MLLSPETIAHGLPIDMDIGDFFIAVGFPNPYIAYMTTLPQGNTIDLMVLDETDRVQRKNFLYVNGLRDYLRSRYAVILKPTDFDILVKFN